MKLEDLVGLDLPDNEERRVAVEDTPEYKQIQEFLNSKLSV